MLDEGFIRDLECLGFSVSEAPREALRLLKPGSILDRVRVTARCSGCGIVVSETIRWFYERKFICECGSRFEAADLDKLITLLRRGCSPSDAVARIGSIELIEPIVEEDD